MANKKIAGFLVTAGFVFATATVSLAQDPTTQTQSTAQPTPDAAQHTSRLDREGTGE